MESYKYLLSQTQLGWKIHGPFHWTNRTHSCKLDFSEVCNAFFSLKTSLRCLSTSQSSHHNETISTLPTQGQKESLYNRSIKWSSSSISSSSRSRSSSSSSTSSSSSSSSSSSFFHLTFTFDYKLAPGCVYGSHEGIGLGPRDAMQPCNLGQGWSYPPQPKSKQKKRWFVSGWEPPLLGKYKAILKFAISVILRYIDWCIYWGGRSLGKVSATSQA